MEEALKFSQDKLAALTKNEEKIRQQYNYYRDQETILTLNMNRCYAYIQSDVGCEGFGECVVEQVKVRS